MERTLEAKKMKPLSRKFTREVWAKANEKSHRNSAWSVNGKFL